jgi:hypothetical protein
MDAIFGNLDPNDMETLNALLDKIRE